jgi:hypothetical protein
MSTVVVKLPSCVKPFRMTSDRVRDRPPSDSTNLIKREFAAATTGADGASA